MRRSFLPGFEVPFVLVDVELSDHPQIRMIGRLIDGPAAPLQIGTPVEVAFEDVRESIAIPAFTLADPT